MRLQKSRNPFSPVFFPFFISQERINRRMSTSFLQHLLVKQHNEKDETESQGSSDRGSLAELSASAASLPPLIPPSRDHCATIAQLLHYIHGLVVRSIIVLSHTNRFTDSRDLNAI